MFLFNGFNLDNELIVAFVGVGLFLFFAEGEQEFEAVRVGEFCVDVAAVEDDGVFYDGQAEPCAAGFAAAAFVYAVEAFEKASKVFGGDACAVVAEAEVVAVVVGGVADDVDVCSVACVGDGVVHEVAEYGVEE